jgi:hypothetical protein
MHAILSLGVIIPSTSQSKLTFAISVLTSPGCSANTTVFSSLLFHRFFLSNSAAKWRNPWFKAAFDAAYAPNPSSKARKFVVEPESEEMNTSVLTVRGVDGPQVGETGMPAVVVGGEESESRR